MLSLTFINNLLSVWNFIPANVVASYLAAVIFLANYYFGRCATATTIWIFVDGGLTQRSASEAPPEINMYHNQRRHAAATEGATLVKKHSSSLCLR